MQKNMFWSRVRLLVLFAVLGLLLSTHVVFAETSTSPNYKATEMQFGSGSSLESCSGEYCAQASIGDIAVGESSSPGESSASFGSVEEEPLLEVIVDPGISNLGFLDTENTASKTMIVRVRNYLSNGYTLQINGEPPVYDGHALSTSSTPVVSNPGNEQFGINLAANTSPSVGAVPEQVPSVETSFGEVEAGYSTPNQFQFTSGDIVARSSKESGRTDYTVSMIVNIANDTPAGHYNGEFSAVVVPIY